MLCPGDSGLGLRLPLPSLPWVAPDEMPSHCPRRSDGRSRAAAVPPASSYRRSKHPYPPSPIAAAIARPTVGESAPWIVRTALCVEPRDGRLHVFMPPLAPAEDYIDLLAAIEDTAAHLQMPVVIEGYTPPYRSIACGTSASRPIPA